MALRLSAEIAGERVAELIQLGIEYDPDPPYRSGSAESAPTELLSLARAAISAEDERTAAMLDDE
jgi:cyclohexyl-isocyanide hydratase